MAQSILRYRRLVETREFNAKCKIQDARALVILLPAFRIFHFESESL